MIIHCLEVSGFRIMGKPVELQFPEEGRIGILGQNESGKTTLLQAIECALYGLRKGAKIDERGNLVTWGKNEAKLKIEFTSGQERYVLRRVFGARSGHRAVLVPVISGVADRSNSITGLKEITAKVEQITGMDRDSFTKLVYIRQKDLDALKELAKSKREQLVNKVMGIEIFDTASADVKRDISDLQNDLNTKTLQLDSVRRNKEQYETKRRQRADLESSVANLRENLKQKQGELRQANDLLERYDWLYASKSTNEVVNSLRERASGVERDMNRMTTLTQKINEYEAALAEYRPQVEQLVNLQATFAKLEGRVKEAEDSVDSIEGRRQDHISKTGVTGEELEMLSKDLPAEKSRKLKGFGISLAAGIGLFIVGSTLNPFLVLVSLFLFAISAYLFRRYSRLDSMIAANAELNSLTQQLREQRDRISGLEGEIRDLASKTSFGSQEKVNIRLSAILEEVKTATGQSSVEGVEAVAKNAQTDLELLKASDPVKKKMELQKHIQAKEDERAKLQKAKPTSVDKLQYDRDEHEAAKQRVKRLQQEASEVQKELQSRLGTMGQLDQDLKELKSDYDLYPKLDEEVRAYQTRLQLLKRVLLELSETGKELRNQVIPHARFIINQILPTLTDGRYSDFEITQDLKFKVHSREAGGYREREIFSGGTQDQFLIALRLAFTQSILDSRVMADKYCLLMDECISSSDDVRKQGIFEVLEAMKKVFSQIFVIAHEDISDFVDNHIVLARNDDGYSEIRSRSWPNV